MADDINLTHRLGEWHKRPGSPAPGPGGTAPFAPPRPPAERRLRADAFAWLAYLLLGAFLAGQILWMLATAG